MADAKAKADAEYIQVAAAKANTDLAAIAKLTAQATAAEKGIAAATANVSALATSAAAAISKASSDATFASNAKDNAEAHAARTRCDAQDIRRYGKSAVGSILVSCDHPRAFARFVSEPGEAAGYRLFLQRHVRTCRAARAGRATLARNRLREERPDAWTRCLRCLLRSSVKGRLRHGL